MKGAVPFGGQALALARQNLPPAVTEICITFTADQNNSGVLEWLDWMDRRGNKTMGGEGGEIEVACGD
jgi:hypothetical protein